MRIKQLIPQWFLQIIFFTPAKLSVILLIWTTTNISGKKCHTIKNVIPHHSWRDKLSFHSEVTREPYIMRFSIFLFFFFFFWQTLFILSSSCFSMVCEMKFVCYEDVAARRGNEFESSGTGSKLQFSKRGLGSSSKTGYLEMVLDQDIFSWRAIWLTCQKSKLQNHWRNIYEKTSVEASILHFFFFFCSRALFL